MKIAQKIIALVFLSAITNVSLAQTPSSTTVFNPYDMYEAQFDATLSSFLFWSVPNDITEDLIRLTDSSNSGAPLNAYIDPHFYVDRGSGVAIFRLDESAIDYNNLNNLPSLGTAASQNSSAFATAAQGTTADNAQPFITAGTTGQYYRGDKTWVSFPAIPTATSQLSNDSGFITSSALAPYATTAALTSGLAGKFNVPSGTTAQYVRGDGSLATLPSPGSGTVTSVGLTSSNLTVTGSPITTSGTLTVTLPNTGTAGTYSGVTTDAVGRVTAGTTRSFNNAATKTLVTSPTGAGGVVLDASRDVLANYSVATSSTATIGGASSVTIFLEIATTNSTTAGDWTTIAKASNGQTITLAVVLQSVQSNIMNFGGVVPAGYYARIRYAVTGTASAAFDSGQEVKL